MKNIVKTKQAEAARIFVEKWRGKGYEKGQGQPFWMELLQSVFGVENISSFITFEQQVKLDHTAFIDAFIPRTHVMIEQKSINKSLDEPIKQSDGSFLTPFRQAKRYSSELPYSQRPRWIVTCNFAEFWVYDMEQPDGDPQKILLENLEKEYYRLQFLVDEKDEHIRKELEVSVKAGELVGIMYDKLIEQYIDKTSAETLRSLNILCVRLVFCLYAEDAGLFQSKTAFHDYLAQFPAQHFRKNLIELFKTLDTPLSERDPYLEPSLSAFPYVNGGLFKEEDIEIPQFTDELRQILLDNASSEFDWSEISPTIFGAVFESTLNPDTRRKGGMHYTSIENIHKVIDPLFLDELWAEYTAIVEMHDIASIRERDRKLLDFQKKISSLTFLDPACGSGNFLTETFMSLRRLENQLITELSKGQMFLGFDEVNPVKVNIHQFYGIEINDFAVTVAKTALWIAEHQMLRETEAIIHYEIDMLPLKSYANIVEGNALRMDWRYIQNKDMFVSPPTIHAGQTYLQFEEEKQSRVEEPKQEYETVQLVTKKLNFGLYEESAPAENHYDYIMGNPPFVGARMKDACQKNELLNVFGKIKNSGNLDYVACWYRKAADLIKDETTRCALVSTNSITQGEQMSILWKPIFEDGISIDFAWRTFRWDSESTDKARVHCVVIGFSSTCSPKKAKYIYESDDVRLVVDNINGYLLDSQNVFVESRQHPLCNVPEIGIGNKPIDGGNYLFTEEQKNQFVLSEPESEKYFRKWVGAEEFINGYNRWCLWLGDCPPEVLINLKECMKRVSAVRKFRLTSKSTPTQKLAECPTQFHVKNMPDGNYLIIPRVSSERRRYIPIGFMTPDTLAGDSVHIIPDASLYHFGVLTSSIHNAWMRVVCGRLESRYRYSKDIVYNNFPWPAMAGNEDENYGRIAKTAQDILDARSEYSNCSLAQLYGENGYLFQDLVNAHAANDRAVMEAYGFPVTLSDDEIVARLFELYGEMTKNEK